MKKIQKIFIIMASVLLIMVMMPANTEAASATVKLNKKTLTMYAGGSTTLKMTGTAKKLKWSSSKKSVATVSSKGVVTAKKHGKAVITVKSGSKKATCKVTVKNRLSAKKAVEKFNSQTKKAKNITVKYYKDSVKTSNYLLTLAVNIDSKVTYIAMDGDEMYFKGKRIYWYDKPSKKWYYYINNNGSDDVLDIKPTDLLITGNKKYKNAGVKTFDGKKCQALKITEGNSSFIYYLDLADYSIVGLSQSVNKEKMIILIDTKKTVEVPQNATYKVS